MPIVEVPLKRTGRVATKSAAVASLDASNWFDADIGAIALTTRIRNLT